MEIIVDLMSFRVLFSFPDAFFPNIQNRLFEFICSNGTSSMDTDIEIKIELLEKALPEKNIKPQASFISGTYRFRRYDMDGEYVTDKKKLKLKTLNNIYSFDTALRVIFSHLLIDRGSFLIHSSSVIHRGRGILFLGISGSGKTTIANLPDEKTVLSDEISAVIKQDEGYFIYGNTFLGEVNGKKTNQRNELDQIYLLNQAPYNSIKKAKGNKAVMQLIRNIMCFVNDKDYIDKVMQNIIDLLCRVDVSDLYFKPHPEIYDKIIEHLDRK